MPTVKRKKIGTIHTIIIEKEYKIKCLDVFCGDCFADIDGFCILFDEDVKTPDGLIKRCKKCLRAERKRK